MKTSITLTRASDQPMPRALSGTFTELNSVHLQAGCYKYISLLPLSLASGVVPAHSCLGQCGHGLTLCSCICGFPCLLGVGSHPIPSLGPLQVGLFGLFLSGLITPLLHYRSGVQWCGLLFIGVLCGTGWSVWASSWPSIASGSFGLVVGVVVRWSLFLPTSHLGGLALLLWMWFTSLVLWDGSFRGLMPYWLLLSRAFPSLWAFLAIFYGVCIPLGLVSGTCVGDITVDIHMA